MVKGEREKIINETLALFRFPSATNTKGGEIAGTVSRIERT